MKLQNHTLSYLSIILLPVIGVWAIIFYVNIFDEIYDSIDDGLENSKILILEKIQTDTTLLHRKDFLESNYAIHEISATQAAHFKDVYLDSTLYMQNEKDYEPVRILKSAFRAFDGKYYQLEVVSSMVEEDDLIEDLFYSIIWLYLILLAGILVVNSFILKRIWKPFYEILDRLKFFSLDKRETLPETKTTVTEFNMLNETVSSLLQRTVHTFNNQKQFIENASHELQTPLAITINKLELLAEKSNNETQLQEIASIIESLERLTRLNKTLLLLSRIENQQFTEQSLVGFNELSEHLMSEYADLAAYKSVALSINHEGNLTQQMNPELAQILVSNLLKNGILHNHAGGTVEIKIQSGGIFIENTGNAVKLDESRIFERFYKNTGANTSTGLGLSIVKTITDYYRFGLSYTYNGKHQFAVRIPASVKNIGTGIKS
ncbi:HAMP domain-containing sensor histidine kinase [Chryseolinea sp. H1M3-3]|uniref:sensor histidine kinase n=1 Tax=Chryseolinea sp. H1M3-3 TaxID=3034144 RepID=UPI0023EC18D3|nr:HAMP domain-containing sensor histidine kinase [Chryseolinea sp. H1M3-3]